MATAGYIDGIRGTFLLGWAYNPDNPEDRLELEVELDGEPVGRCTADLSRSDLAKRGVGDGRHGFRIELPGPLAAGETHMVKVRSGDGTILPLSKSYFANPDGESHEKHLTLHVGPLTPGAEQSSNGATIPGGGKPSAARTTDAPAAEHPVEPRRALVGREGWLFPFAGAPRLAHVLGTATITPDRIRHQRDHLRSTHKRLAELRVGYLLAAMPDKAAVYRDRLPGSFEFETEGRPADRIAAVLRNDPRLEILDLLPALRHARRSEQVFQREGRLVTWTGAYHAYRAVIKELSKRFGPIRPSFVELGLRDPADVTDPLRSLERVTLVGGETVPVADGEDSREQEPDLDRRNLAAMYVPLPDELAKHLSPRAALLEREESDLPRAVVVHDGSGGRLVPFLAEHFSRTLVDVADALPFEAIAEEQPLVVVHVVSEAGPFFA